MAAWWGKHRKQVLRLGGTVLAIVLLALLMRDNSWGEIVSAFRSVKTSDLLWVALLFLISRVATTLRWHVLLRSGGMNMRLKDSLALTFTGLFASNFLPTTIGGDVVRLAGVMQMGFDRAISLASIAADRLIGMLGMAMLLPSGIYFSWGLLQVDPKTLFSTSFLQRPLAFVKKTLSVFGIWFKRPDSLLLSLLFTWIHMLCLFGSIYIFFDDLGTPVSFWMIASLWCLTYFVTLLPISINGYGLQELSFTFFMSNVAGIPQTVSLSVAVLLRAYFILSSLPGAFFLPSIMSAMGEQKEDSLSTDIFL
jgi:hypothetical protein